MKSAFDESELRGRLEALAIGERGEDADAPLWLVLEGDYGGQIYLTVPWRLVRKSASIARLLHELDQFAWECNEGDGAEAYITGDSGRIDVDMMTDGLWMHPEFGPRHVARSRKLLKLGD